MRKLGVKCVLLQILYSKMALTGRYPLSFILVALQFISELDDIGFSLAKINGMCSFAVLYSLSIHRVILNSFAWNPLLIVLGKKLQRACTAKLYQTEFEKLRFKRNRKSSLFLKSVYFINLAAFIGGMIFVSTRQTSGYCKSTLFHKLSLWS